MGQRVKAETRPEDTEDAESLAESEIPVRWLLRKSCFGFEEDPGAALVSFCFMLALTKMTCNPTYLFEQSGILWSCGQIKNTDKKRLQTSHPFSFQEPPHNKVPLNLSERFCLIKPKQTFLVEAVRRNECSTWLHHRQEGWALMISLRQMLQNDGQERFSHWPTREEGSSLKDPVWRIQSDLTESCGIWTTEVLKRWSVCCVFPLQDVFVPFDCLQSTF